jgi:hypothetical protein
MAPPQDEGFWNLSTSAKTIHSSNDASKGARQQSGAPMPEDCHGAAFAVHETIDEIGYSYFRSDLAEPADAAFPAYRQLQGDVRE